MRQIHESYQPNLSQFGKNERRKYPKTVNEQIVNHPLTRSYVTSTKPNGMPVKRPTESRIFFGSQLDWSELRHASNDR